MSSNMSHIELEELQRRSIDTLIDQCHKNPKLKNDKDIQIVINTGKQKIKIQKDYVPRIIPLSYVKINHPKDLRILLITKDPSTIYREAIEKDESLKDLIKEIITVKNLKRRFRGSKINEMYNEFDVVVADYRVHHLLPDILGRKFFSGNKKVPFMIRMSHAVKVRRQQMTEECDTKYLRAQLKSICKNTYFLPNADNCLNVRIGILDKHNVDEMLSNVIDIANFLTDPKKRPQGGVIKGGIESIFVKTSNSTSLPLYMRPNKPDQEDVDLKNFKL